MRDIPTMFGGHIKSKTIIKLMKPYVTMAKNNAKNGEFFWVNFDKVFIIPVIAEDGICTLLDQRDEKEALGFDPTNK